ncbi:MAG TPA: glycosyltransferase 87 family protein [Chloroflexota bacterium]|nr:glycosyltransferase 87 family protein [Chloroflexota bacterium]
MPWWFSHLLIAVLWTLCLLLFVLSRAGNGSGGDFLEWYTAADQIRHGALYDSAQFHRLAHALGGPSSRNLSMGIFPQPPQIAWLIQPLLLISERSAYGLYTVLNAAGLGLGTYWLLDGWPRRQRLIVTTLLVCGLSGFMCLLIGTDTWLVALALGLAWHGRLHDRPVLAGAAITLGLVKPYRKSPEGRWLQPCG